MSKERRNVPHEEQRMTKKTNMRTALVLLGYLSGFDCHVCYTCRIKLSSVRGSSLISCSVAITSSQNI